MDMMKKWENKIWKSTQISNESWSYLVAKYIPKLFNKHWQKKKNINCLEKKHPNMNTHGRVWPNAEGINTPPNHFCYNCEVNELTTEQPMYAQSTQFNKGI